MNAASAEPEVSEFKKCSSCGELLWNKAKRCHRCRISQGSHGVSGEVMKSAVLLFLGLAVVVAVVGGVAFTEQGDFGKFEENGSSVVVNQSEVQIRLRELRRELRKLQEENRSMSSFGITDARAFSGNDQRILSLSREIKSIESRTRAN